MVEQVEEFSPELQVHTFAEGQREVLDERKIGIHKPRTVNRSPGCGAKLSRRSLCESARIEPVLNCVNSSRAVRPAALRARLVWVPDLVRTLEGASIVGEEDSRSIAAVHDEQRKSGRYSFNKIHLPVPQYSVGGATPIAAELSPFAEWQVIQDASCETIVKVQLRQTPIELGTSGQRIVDCARIGPESIGHPGVECARPGVAQKGIDTVTRTLSFSLYLEGIVASRSHAVISCDLLEWCRIRPVIHTAAYCIGRIEQWVRHGLARAVDNGWETRRGRFNVFIRLADQNVRATGACIASGQHDISWQLVLHIQVELLNRTLPEVAIHGLNRSGIIRRADRTGQNGAARDWGARRSARRNQEAS